MNSLHRFSRPEVFLSFVKIFEIIVIPIFFIPIIFIPIILIPSSISNLDSRALKRVLVISASVCGAQTLVYSNIYGYLIFMSIMFWKYLIQILWLNCWRILFFPNQGFSKAHEEIQEKANSLRKIQCSDSPYSTHCDSQRLRCKDSPSFDSQPWWKSYDLISNYDRSSGDEDEINENDFDCSVTVLMITWKLHILHFWGAGKSLL